MNLFCYKRSHKFIVYCLVFAFVLSAIGTPIEIYATRTGNVVCTEGFTVNTRQDPSTSSAILNRLANGKPLTILDEVSGQDGYLWYKVSYVLNATGETKVAYIRSDYVSVNGETPQEGPKEEPITKEGTVCRDNVFVRDAAGTVGTNQILSLYIGDKVTIIGECEGEGGKWYHVAGTKDSVNYDGWAFAEYIAITIAGDNSEESVDGDYAQELRNAGFPEDYIVLLVNLHNKYPKWKFEAVDTGVDWSTAVSMESTNGKNLVQNSENDAKKSISQGAYDWETNVWTIYDGSSWVSAHTDYIAYCMDPRNFLNDNDIYMFEGLSYSEEQNLAGVQAILSGTFMANDAVEADGTTWSYADAFLEIGRQTGVSPYHLAARVRQEQGISGSSNMISGNYPGYEGYYNYFNYGAYGTTTEIVLQSGLLQAQRQGWNTRYLALLGGARMLALNYISKGQDTIYFQKFNVVNAANLYSHQYMSNVSAAISEGRKLGAGYIDKSQAFVFRIPIYRNMPAIVVGFNGNGNPNNYLRELYVTNHELTPNFRGAVTEYSSLVDYSVDKVQIGASAVALTSVIAGVGDYNLEVGQNLITVSCTAKNGAVRNYSIVVVRTSEPEVQPQPEPESQPEVQPQPEPEPQPEVQPQPEPEPQPEVQPEQPQLELPQPTPQPQPEGTPTPQPVPQTQPSGSGNTGAGVASSSVYQIQNIVTKVSPSTRAADMLSRITVNGGSTAIVNSSGKKITGYVPTGSTLAVYDNLGNLVSSHTIVVYGDINGDGLVNALDMIKLNRHILGLGTLSGAYLEAADANRSKGTVNALDMIVLNRHILGIKAISQ